MKIRLPIKDFDINSNRLDVWVTEAIKACRITKQELNNNNLLLSRSRIKKIIKGNNLFVDDVLVNDPSFKIQDYKVITIFIPTPIQAIPLPQNIDLDVIYEDDFLIILNKKAGMVVHPAPGSKDRTLVNALLYRCGESLQGIGGVKRPGIVHRLDKNTSGVMVVAKTELAHFKLCQVFKHHDLDRRYNALVWGQPDNVGVINKPIGRSHINRKKMAISKRGKIALTKWRILDIYSPLASLLECQLETGRTHQIRVHCSSIGHGVIGDNLYGKSFSKKNLKSSNDIEKLKLINLFDRQALHATQLCFRHPITNKYLEFVCSLPDDIMRLIKILKNN